MTDEKYMKRALALAQKGVGAVNPNPLVGAVIVKNGKIIGEGYHERYGELHAERNAFKNLTEPAKGATLYVTLEPCAHTGHQPPCFEAIIDHHIKRVVIGHYDPNPLVSGKGIEQMRAQGIEVDGPILEKECEAVNEIFFHYMTQKSPFVMLKYAMTMDGKIATYTGASQWITGEKAREKVHQDRSKFSAIMVGIGTVLADDPLLTSRIEKGRNPIRIIADRQLQTPLESQIVQTASTVQTMIATTVTDAKKYERYQKKGVEILTISEKEGHLDLEELMGVLYSKQIDSLIIEGGATLNAAALEAGIVQKVQTYIAPKIFGGSQAQTPVAGQGVAHPSQAYQLKNPKIIQLGQDFLIESEVE